MRLEKGLHGTNLVILMYAYNIKFTLFFCLSDGGIPHSHLQQEDDDIAHAVSLSFKVMESSFCFGPFNLYSSDPSDS